MSNLALGTLFDISRDMCTRKHCEMRSELAPREMTSPDIYRIDVMTETKTKNAAGEGSQSAGRMDIVFRWRSGA